MDPIVLTAPRIFWDKFLWIVQIAGVSYSGFNKCSELKGEVGVIEHSEGGALTPSKSPGRVTWPNVTLERGASVDQDLLDWWLQVIDISAVGPVGDAGVGFADPLFRRDVDIIQMSRTKRPIEGFRLINAWPVSFVYADGFDNDADGKTIRKLELAIEGIEYRPIALAA